MVREVAWALAYAHQQGVIHRDVKPENILLERVTGRALVADFGIAHLMEATPVTPHGDLIGTARYASPEQAAGEALDGRSDLYSLGVTAYFALTGRDPFEADGAAALLAQHLTVPAPPVASVRPGIPRVLAQVVDRCLAKDPELRYPTGEALAAALEREGAHLPAVPPTLSRLVRETSSLGVDLAGYGTLGAIVTLCQALTAGQDFLGLGEVYTIGIALLLTTLVTLKGLTVGNLTRQAVREGWALDDLRQAIRADVAAREPEAPRKLGRAGATAIYGAGFIGTVLLWLGPREALLGTLEGPFAFLVELVAFGLPIVLGRWFGGRLEEPRRGKPGLFSRFALWKGSLLFRLGGLGLRRRSGPALPAAAPTEVMLASQAQDLFDALPTDQRRRLSEVGDAIARLTTEAGRLRTRDAELAQAAAETGSPGDPVRDKVRAEFEAERHAVARQLGETLASLDTLRLDLLRLRAGTATPEGLTGALEVVRRVSREVDAALEVDQLDTGH